ncbi:hypothetical protein NLS1_41100 [Nocardioides sp. LS1]|nr:hypothetical protein NLS1_41100 [Nocardioides sp. LS1]
MQRVGRGVGGAGEQLLAVVGQQPPEVVEVHEAILAERWANVQVGFSGTPLGRVLTSDLALSP